MNGQAETACGQRQLHHTLDHIASTSPGRLYAAIPVSSNVGDGFRDISFRDMARCSEAAANWIEEHLGRSQSFETLCYIGIPDLCGAAIFFGAVKCGYKLFLASSGNTPITTARLLEQTGCNVVLHAAQLGTSIEKIHAIVQEKVHTYAFPSFLNLLKSDPKPFAYKKRSWADAITDPVVILHSSGSTGQPKPITMTHGSFSVLDLGRKLRSVPGRKNFAYGTWDLPGEGRFYHLYPIFHLSGFTANIVQPAFTECSSPVLGPPFIPPTGNLLREIMTSQPLMALFIPPSIIEHLLQDPSAIKLFEGLQFVMYTGGPLTPAAGEKIVQVTQLFSAYGSTETFALPQLIPGKEDWAYMEWHPDSKYDLQPCPDEEGTYEMVVFPDQYSPLEHNLPGVEEWRTKDLFKQHPQKPHLWQYYGRRDDIIVLSTGRKFNPVPFELALQSHTLLSGALVIGQGRPVTTLLVEPKEDGDKDALAEAIWPAVLEANKLIPRHGHVSRNCIIVANKAFKRAAKGTVVRKLTEKDFESDIEALYAGSKTMGVLDYIDPTLSDADSRARI